MSRELRSCHETAKQLLEQGNQLLKNRHENPHIALKLSEGMQYIYVCLYQSNGSQLSKWEQLITTLGGTSIGRPIYENERDAQQAIQTKGNSPNEGYLVVAVDKTHFLQSLSGRDPKDAQGRKLLLLSEHAIKTNNIHQFIHANKDSYYLQNGTLVRNELPQAVPNKKADKE